MIDFDEPDEPEEDEAALRRKALMKKIEQLPPDLQPVFMEKFKRRLNAKPFYCARGRSCDGMPHAGANYNHARGDQYPPLGEPAKDWKTWANVGGRGSGKTRTGSEYSLKLSRDPQAIGNQMAIIAPTAADLRDTIVEGPSGLLTVCEMAGEPGKYEPSKSRFTFESGARALLISADEPKRLRGKQFGFCFPAGVMVQAEDGPRAIETLQVGDRVWTRNGLRSIHRTGYRQAEVIEVEHEGGVVRTTPDHPFWTQRGWVEAELISPGDILSTWSGKSTDMDVLTAISEAVSSIGIGTTGSSITGAPSRMDTKSTTSTSIDSTTTPRTSSRSRRKSTARRTTRTRRFEPASAVAPSSSKGEGDLESIAIPAESWSSVSISEKPMQTARAQSRHASGAVDHSRPVVGSSVVSRVSTMVDVTRVYNIGVEETPEFFAEGILVHNCWADEPAHYEDPQEVWDQLMFCLRLGTMPHILLTTTPLPTPWMKARLADPRTRATRASTFANRANLAEDTIRELRERYEGTRLGRQELHGEILDDVEGALWNGDMFVRADKPEAFDKVVVGVDPAGSANKRSDLTGIVVVGKVGKLSYVLDDLSGTYTPEQWAGRVKYAYDKWEADSVVVERNYGGDLVRSNLKTLDEFMRIREVRATRGKAVRAEPVVSRYEQGRVLHVIGADLAKLETEQVSWVPSDPKSASPNRVDALVWADTDLHGKGGPVTIASALGKSLR